MPVLTPWPDRRPTGRWLVGLTLFGLALLPAHAALQQARPAQNLVPVSEETALIAQGWAALAVGDAVTAADKAQLVLGKYPLSVGALALAVEAAIARNGAMSGLTTYESWLGQRRLEDPFVIRRIAIAALRETMNSTDARGRIVALKALAAEGDAQALSKLAEGNARGQLPETRVMAELGDARAVQALIKQLESAPQGTSKMRFIEALAGTKSKLAVPAVLKRLDDPDIFVVAAAADALGKLDAKESIARLRPLVEEGHPGPQRWAAARALSLMGDGGGTLFLRQMLIYQNPDSSVAQGASDMLQIQAAEGLAPLGPNPDWINTARRLAGSSSPEVRLYAAKVIAAQDQSVAKETLEGLLLDPNPAICQEAADILASRVAGDFVTLRRLVRSADPYSQALAAARIVELTR